MRLRARWAALLAGVGLVVGARGAWAQQAGGTGTSAQGAGAGAAGEGTQGEGAQGAAGEGAQGEGTAGGGAAGAGEGTQGGEGAQGEGAQGEGAQGEGEGTQGEGSSAAEAPVTPLTEAQRRLLVSTPGDLPEAAPPGTRHFVLPPYAYEWGPDHHTRVVFPLYFESRNHDDRRLLIPPYYRLRSPHADGDVVFPLFFNFRGRTADGRSWGSTVIPPVWAHSSHGPGRAHAAAYGFFPLFSYAEIFNREGWLEHEHFVTPLSYHQWWRHGSADVVLLYYHFRNRGNVDWGLPPFVIGHSSPTESWSLVPLPPFVYHHVTHETNRSFTLVGPFWSDIGPQSATVNLAPLFFHWHDRTHTRNGVVPFFFQESGPDYSTLATPLFVYTRDHAESTVVTPLYQNHRGLTSFDSVLPLFFYSRAPRLGQSTVVVFPFMFNTSSPTGYAWGAFPFAARFREYGRYDTVVTPLFAHSENPEHHSTFTWVFPTIHRETSPDSSLLNIYPLVWSAHGRGWHHRVFFPLYWDIGSRELRREITIVAPIFGRVRNGDDMTQWSFPNHVYWESRHDGFRAFGWDNFPFAQYGEPRRGDFYWSAFEGLVGYRRQGSYEQLRLFWIPIDLRGSRGSQGGSSQQARGGRNGDVLLDM